ncbi:uncharacterized protein [Salminus brasiliensis]|uniref:uncharacterized protein n=1 Tax=Salminus brasiliensis TaxID=930266 RepID=UPI003B83977F
MSKLRGVPSDSSEWGVNYTEAICAVRGSNVTIPCSYSYPNSEIQAKAVHWCSMNFSKGICPKSAYFYNSSSPYASDVFQYAGDKQSNCTLLIRNVQFSHSAVYKFRFITKKAGKWTGEPGVTLEVGALLVIRQSGNGTLKEGDSVNLTCDVNCSHSYPQFVWFKDSERLPTSGSILHLPALTVDDSGNYSCALETDETLRSETLSINVEGLNWLVVYLVIMGGTVAIVLLIMMAIICNRRKKVKAQEESAGESDRKIQDGESTHGEQRNLQTNQILKPAEALLQEEEVMYASVCKTSEPKNGKKKKTQAENDGGSGGKTQVGESVQSGLLQDGDVMYASVRIKPNKPKGSPISTVHLEEDDSVIYSAVAGK